MAVFIIGLKPKFLPTAPAWPHLLPTSPRPHQPHWPSCLCSNTTNLSLPLPMLFTWTGSQLQHHLPRKAFQTSPAKAASIQDPSHPQAVSSLFRAPVSLWRYLIISMLTAYLHSLEWRLQEGRDCLVHCSLPGTKNSALHKEGTQTHVNDRPTSERSLAISLIPYGARFSGKYLVKGYWR